MRRLVIQFLMDTAAVLLRLADLELAEREEQGRRTDRGSHEQVKTLLVRYDMLTE